MALLHAAAGLSVPLEHKNFLLRRNMLHSENSYAAVNRILPAGPLSPALIDIHRVKYDRTDT